MSYPPTTTSNSITTTEKTTMNSILSLKVSLSISFFLLGLLNNVLYVVILSAALDLVTTAPKGLILLANIFPSLIVKLFWAYLVIGEVRYAKRIISCSLLSFGGILVVAMSSSLSFRLLGISIASFSSGLGEMTYLQLSTLYTSSSSTTSASTQKKGLNLSSIALGWFASGTGAAGLVGAGLWWFLRSLGVKEGLLICSFLPLCMAATYFLLLPAPSSFLEENKASYATIPEFEILEEEDEEDADESAPLNNTTSASSISQKEEAINLTTAEKFVLAKPLVVRFMLPLFFVYLAEYTINTGVAPTLIYPIPSPSTSPFLSSIIKSLRDYYPLWQLIYQTFVFLSRSSLTLFHLPPLPLKFLPLPTIIQLIILTLTILESSTSFIHESLGFSEDYSIVTVAFLVALEGLCGGAAYVNVFYRLGLDFPTDSAVDVEEGGLPSVAKKKEERGEARKAKEREFRIASVGFADTLGILVASLISMLLEPALCDIQVGRGRNYCKEL